MPTNYDDEPSLLFLDLLHEIEDRYALDRKELRPEPPSPIGYVCEPTEAERSTLEHFHKHLTNTLGEAPRFLVTRRDDHVLVYASTLSGEHLDETRLATRIRSYQQGVLDVHQPENRITFDVNGRRLDTREQRGLNQIDLSNEYIRYLGRER